MTIEWAQSIIQRQTCGKTGGGEPPPLNEEFGAPSPYPLPQGARETRLAGGDGIDLQEGMDFVAGEDALGDIGIACREGLGFLQRVGGDDDQAAGAVGERPCQDHPPGLVQRVHPLEVSLAVQLALGLAVRSVVPDDDEDHTQPGIFMTVRDEIAQTPSETGAWRREGGRRTGDPLLCKMQRVASTLTD